MSGSRKISVWLSLLLLALASSWLFFLRDRVGIHWDEPWQQNLGVKVYDYASDRNAELMGIQNRFHGAAFEWTAEWICRLSGTYSFASKVPLRRTVLILFFLMGAIALAFAAVELTNDFRAGPLSLLLLLCTPRMMGHAAFNTKDIPLLAAACFFLFFSIRFFRKPNYLTAIFCGIFAGLMVSLRIPGVFVFGLWPVWIWFSLKRASLVFRIKTVFVFLLTAGACTLLFWPVLWDNPLQRFGEAWQFMSRFPWDDPVLYRGQFIPANRLSADYLPIWILITTPWILLIGLVLSFSVLLKADFPLRMKHAFLWAFALIPPAAVILLRSVVYDEWRHVFFIYPALILVAVGGFLFVIKRAASHWVKWGIGFLFIFQVAETGLWVLKHAEYPYLYFSPWIRNRTCGQFEQAYWGQTYAEANRYFLKEYSGKPFRVAYVHAPGYYNRWMLSDADKQKIIPVAYDTADYLVTNHRFEREKFNFGEAVFEQWVNGCSVITVYKKNR
jgi:hypothetical protein